MGNWQDITLADIARGFARYRPFLAVIAAVVAVTAFLPGQVTQTDVAADRGIEDVLGSTATTAPAGTESTVASSDPAAATASGSAATINAGRAGAAGRAGGAVTGGTSAASTGTPTEVSGTQAVTTAEGVGPDCDQATGRLRMPSRFAPPCKPPLTGSNGGATSPGVSDKEITVVWYRGVADPAVQAALTAAGASDDRENVDHTITQYADLLNHHYYFYGRKIKFIIHNGEAEADDDAAGRSDAIAVADKHKPFLVINSVNNAFVDELVARKIICICTTSQPQEFYEQRFPYAGWTTLMSSSQGYIHRAEYIGKRLARQKAQWAGYRDSPADPMNDEERVFGLLYYETPDNAYRGGVEFFKKELARYGVTLKEALAYPSNLAQAQEQTRPLISKLKASGVTSVIFSGDPITPATFTTEANNQQWQPEWIITGSALTDTTLFARTYNQDQWSRAFGISYLNLRFPEEQGTAYRLHVWHSGGPPRAGNTYGVLWAPFFITGTGIMGAGANLTPQTFAKGLFEYPPTGRGFVTASHTSYGRHGIWDRDPWNIVDLTQYDDITEIWWDRTASGPDEVGNNAIGMYRYINGGKRYLPGEQPTGAPKAFDPNGAPTILNAIPENEKPPDYEHKHYYG